MEGIKRSKHEEALFDRLQDIIAELGFVLIDVKLRTESNKRFLRLFVDKHGGIHIDDCEMISKICDPILDEWGEDSHDYFEVQSPGLEKPLQSLVEFSLHIGEEISLSLYQKQDGRKKFKATLIEADEKGIVVKTDDAVLDFNYDDIAQVKRVIQF